MASITTKERTSAKGITSYQVQVRGKGVEKPYSKSFPSLEEAQAWAAEQDRIVHSTTDQFRPTVEPVTAEQAETVLNNAYEKMHGSRPFTARTMTPEEVRSFGSEPKKLTIANIVDEYLRDTQYKGGVKKKGYSTVVQRMSTLAKNLGDKGIDELTKQDIQEYTIKRRGAKALRSQRLIQPSTIRKELEILRRVIRWGVEEKGIKPLVEIKGDLLPPENDGRERVITEEEYKKLCAYTNMYFPWMEPMIILSWETSMRRGEILALVPEWIDFDKREIALPAEVCKNGKARKVPLSTVAMNLLKRLIGEGDNVMQPDQRFFTISGNTLPQRFKRACDACGIKGAVFHSLRHSSITRYAKKPGMNLAFLATISGHRDINMVKKYLHTDSAFIANLMD